MLFVHAAVALDGKKGSIPTQSPSLAVCWHSLLYSLAVVNSRYLSSIRFLAYVDLLGVTYTSSTIATGYGAYIAQPLLRKAVEGREDELTEEQAREIIEQSLRVLFYRDARSLNKVSF